MLRVSDSGRGYSRGVSGDQSDPSLSASCLVSPTLPSGLPVALGSPPPSCALQQAPPLRFSGFWSLSPQTLLQASTSDRSFLGRCEHMYQILRFREMSAVASWHPFGSGISSGSET